MLPPESSAMFSTLIAALERLDRLHHQLEAACAAEDLEAYVSTATRFAVAFDAVRYLASQCRAQLPKAQLQLAAAMLQLHDRPAAGPPS